MGAEEVPEAIVIDNGSYMCKIGFAGDDAPRAVFPCVVGRPKSQISLPNMKSLYIGDEAEAKRGILTLKHPIEGGLITNWDDTEAILHHACSNELRINPVHHPFLITEAPLAPKAQREEMAQVMFETFSVPMLNISNTATLGLIASGRMTGVVLDCGHMASYSVPLFEGYALPYATLKVDIGGRDLTNAFSTMLLELGYNFTTAAEREICRDMKERMCFCSTVDDLSSLQDSQSVYELPSGHPMTVGTQRYRCPEVLFEPALVGKESSGVQDLLYTSIKRCSTDIRKDLYMNMIMSGGSTMFPGFAERITKEIRNKVPEERIKVVAPPERKYSTWIGGSILGSIWGFAERCVTKWEYEEVGPAIVHRKVF